MARTKKSPKLYIIVGPTASGKTTKAINLAKRVDGEIVSADSRQVYRGLNIGTEKVTKREMQSVPHHCIDIASPRRAFSAAQWKRCAEEAIAGIVRRGKTPIVAGGTAFYIDTLLGSVVLPEVPPNPPLRKKLEKESVQELFALLKKKDARRAQAIRKRNELNNKRRLIRALEIAHSFGKVPASRQTAPPPTMWECQTFPHGGQIMKIEWIVLMPSDDVLRTRIAGRLDKTLKKGLVAETRKLRDTLGLSWRRINELGLEYRIVGKYVRGEVSKVQMRNELFEKLWQYAKRQKRWMRKYKNC